MEEKALWTKYFSTITWARLL